MKRRTPQQIELLWGLAIALGLTIGVTVICLFLLIALDAPVAVLSLYVIPAAFVAGWWEATRP